MVTRMRQWASFLIVMSIAFGFATVIGLAIARPSTTYITYEAQPSVLTRLTPSVIAKELLTEKSYKCWEAIVTAESHINPKAKNPNSSARGLGQLLSSTYESLGMKYSPDATTQLVAMLSYLSRHYSPSGDGAICNAWSYWKKFKSY